MQIPDLDSHDKAILTDAFDQYLRGFGHLDAVNYRSDHEDWIDVFDRMERQQLLRREGEDYRVTFVALTLLGNDDAKIELNRCQSILEILKRHYKNPKSRHQEKRLIDIAQELDLAFEQVVRSIKFLMDAASLWFGGSGGEGDNTYVMASEFVVRIKGFDDFIARTQQMFANNQIVVNNVSEFVSGQIVVKEEESDLLRFEALLHPLIIRHSLHHFRDGDFRDAVLNAVIALFDLIRKRTGIDKDGAQLVAQAFSLDKPYLIFSEINSESGQNDQKGFLQILQGVYLGVRNVKAHSLSHDLNQNKAAQYLVLASLLARRIEEAQPGSSMGKKA